MRRLEQNSANFHLTLFGSFWRKLRGGEGAAPMALQYFNNKTRYAMFLKVKKNFKQFMLQPKMWLFFLTVLSFLLFCYSSCFDNLFIRQLKAEMSKSIRRSSKINCSNGPTNTYLISTPIGTCSLVSCARGLHSLELQDVDDDDSFKPKYQIKVQLLSQLYKDNGYTYKPALDAIGWLEKYFTRRHNDSVPDICHFFGDERFTNKVWKVLATSVLDGQTVTYQELAVLAGSAKACRAVGQVLY